MRRAAICLCLAAAWGAAARGPDGALDMIQAPHEVWPAVVRPGDAFDAELTAPPAALRLERNGTAVALEPQPATGFPGRYRCVVPEGLPAGVYALEAEGAAQSGRVERAVHVVEAFPDAYAVAHIAAPAQATPEALHAAAQAVNVSGAPLVLVTGDLTEDGRPEQFRAFLAAIEAVEAPVYAVPGPADVRHGHDRAYLGTGMRAFRFGPDGFMGIPSGHPQLVDPIGPDMGALYQDRRTIRAARWSVGLAARILPRLHMRAQLILFADDPLDWLVASDYGELLGEGGPALPWASVEAVAPPEGAALLQFIDIGPGGLRVRPRTSAAAVQEAR